MMKFRLNCGLVIALWLAASIAWADSLELKNGSLIRGKFLGGTPSQITFQVGSSVQKYNITDIASLKFDSETPAGDMPASPESSLPDAPAVKTPVNVTIPAGTIISVRTIDEIDSAQDRVGQLFQASLTDPIVVQGKTVVARDADVYGRLVESKESGTFTGRSQLRLELTGIVVNGQTVRLVTGEYAVTGKSRGASTAKRTVGGAALGSVIGAIADGGEGAAIGAAAGATAGAGSEVITKGDQVKVPSETLIEFTLQQDISIAAPPI
jgi:outer membrane lipoprotein SlyB